MKDKLLIIGASGHGKVIADIALKLNKWKRLSKKFPFVRVDLYDCEERIIFGELSFTPAAGIADYYSEYGDIYLGKIFKLSTNKIM